VREEPWRTRQQFPFPGGLPSPASGGAESGFAAALCSPHPSRAPLGVLNRCVHARIACLSWSANHSLSVVLSSSIFNHSPAFVLRSSACPKGPSPATSSGSSNSPALSTAFVTPASSSSSSVNLKVNLKYLPVQELVEMIHSERERTAAVERELEQVQCLSRTSDQELRVAKEEALRELTALQNQMDVFKRAELRIKSLGIEEYQDNVLLRLAAAIRDGKLDRTMDMHMLVALAHNAPLERNSRQRRFGNELMRFFVYVFGMRSAKAAHRALTARHEGSADGANAPANLINLPSVEALRNFGKKLDPTDDVRRGGVFSGNIRLAIETCVARQLAIENNLTHLQSQEVVARAKASGGYHQLAANTRLVLKFDGTSCRPSRDWHGDKMVGDVNHLESRARQDVLQKEYDQRLPIWVRQVLRRCFAVSVTPSLVFGVSSVQDTDTPAQSEYADEKEAPGAGEDEEEDGEQDEDYDIDWESATMVDRSMSEELKTRLRTYCVDLRSWLGADEQRNVRDSAHTRQRVALQSRNADYRSSVDATGIDRESSPVFNPGQKRVLAEMSQNVLDMEMRMQAIDSFVRRLHDAPLMVQLAQVRTTIRKHFDILREGAHEYLLFLLGLEAPGAHCLCPIFV